MEVQAWAEFSSEDGVGRDLMPACTQRIDRMEEFDQVTGMDHAAVRSEITRAVPYKPSGQKHSWECFRAYAYPRICLGILKEDVVAGLELLYEIVFKQKSVSFGLHYSIFGIGDLRHHHGCLAGKPFCRYEILRDPLMKILCLTHINHIPLGVIIPIDTRGMRK